MKNKYHIQIEKTEEGKIIITPLINNQTASWIDFDLETTGAKIEQDVCRNDYATVTYGCYQKKIEFETKIEELIDKNKIGELHSVIIQRYNIIRNWVEGKKAEAFKCRLEIEGQ